MNQTEVERLYLSISLSIRFCISRSVGFRCVRVTFVFSTVFANDIETWDVKEPDKRVIRIIAMRSFPIWIVAYHLYHQQNFFFKLLNEHCRYLTFIQKKHVNLFLGRWTMSTRQQNKVETFWIDLEKIRIRTQLLSNLTLCDWYWSMKKQTWWYFKNSNMYLNLLFASQQFLDPEKSTTCVKVKNKY